jgi:hypothetical protein
MGEGSFLLHTLDSIERRFFRGIFLHNALIDGGEFCLELYQTLQFHFDIFLGSYAFL